MALLVISGCFMHQGWEWPRPLPRVRRGAPLWPPMRTEHSEPTDSPVLLPCVNLLLGATVWQQQVPKKLRASLK
jgi:hypothetical protein